MVAFLRTLTPAPPRNQSAEDPSVEAIRRGAAVFRKRGCSTCHEPPAYTSAKSFDVGLADEAGNRMFNLPSLRGVSQAGPFFHDGRARAFPEVFTKCRHGFNGEPPRNELDDLLAFLASL